MYRLAKAIVCLLPWLYCAASLPPIHAEDTKSQEKGKAAPPPAPAAQNSPAPNQNQQPQTPGTGPDSVTLESLDRAVKGGTTLLLIVFVLGTALVWIVMAAKISNVKSEMAKSNQVQNVATGNDLQPMAKTADLQPVAKTTDLQPVAKTADVQPLAKSQEVRDAQTALDTKLNTVRDDLARLSQELTLIKGGNDSVLNLVGRLVPGLPPQIASLMPDKAAVGAEVVILGNNFLNGCRVWFGTVEAHPTQVADSVIRVPVPTGASGDLNVYVQGQNGVSAPLPFKVS